MNRQGNEPSSSQSSPHLVLGAVLDRRDLWDTLCLRLRIQGRVSVPPVGTGKGARENLQGPQQAPCILVHGFGERLECHRGNGRCGRNDRGRSVSLAEPQHPALRALRRPRFLRDDVSRCRTRPDDGCHANKSQPLPKRQAAALLLVPHRRIRMHVGFALAVFPFGPCTGLELRRHHLSTSGTFGLACFGICPVNRGSWCTSTITW